MNLLLTPQIDIYNKLIQSCFLFPYVLCKCTNISPEVHTFIHSCTLDVVSLSDLYSVISVIHAASWTSADFVTAAPPKHAPTDL